MGAGGGGGTSSGGMVGAASSGTWRVLSEDCGSGSFSKGLVSKAGGGGGATNGGMLVVASSETLFSGDDFFANGSKSEGLGESRSLVSTFSSFTAFSCSDSVGSFAVSTISSFGFSKLLEVETLWMSEFCGILLGRISLLISIFSLLGDESISTSFTS